VIDAGLPSEWPPGTWEALQAFRQGDLIKEPPLLYFADPARPTWEMTKRYAPTSRGPEPIEAQGAIRPKYGLITSQTCDIAEDESPQRPKKPWVQIAPVFDASEHITGNRQREWVMGGRFVYLIHLPALPNGLWVADLRIEVPVEKGLFASSRGWVRSQVGLR
jgi:hypothetical protein